jgi:hypothetical protein
MHLISNDEDLKNISRNKPVTAKIKTRKRAIRHISEVVASYLDIPEKTCIRQIENDLLIWRELLCKKPPEIAKANVMKLHAKESYPRWGIAWLIKSLRLEAA